MRFRLAKNETEEWPRLTASTEPVKNHRVWWEGQEQIVAEEKKIKREAEAKVRAAEAEARQKIAEPSSSTSRSVGSPPCPPHSCFVSAFS